MKYCLLAAFAYSLAWLFAAGAIGKSCTELGGKERFISHTIIKHSDGIIRMHAEMHCEGLRN